MEVLSKDIIVTWLLPYLPFPTTGRHRRVAPAEVVGAILYKLKTGCQWRWLPAASLFSGPSLSWQGVYYHFAAWSKQGAWKKLWLQLLWVHRRLLDLSSIQLDGSHTPAKNGGSAVGYQGRKAARTTNALFLADNQGQPLAVATPQAGQHHDTFQLEALFTELCQVLEAAGLNVNGLFLNADKAFDVASLRQGCTRRGIEANIPRNRRTAEWHTDDDTPLDPELYRRRQVVEQLNAWLDGFKTLLVRFETCLHTWLAFHWLAFIVLLLRKMNRPLTS
jgi:transposase